MLLLSRDFTTKSHVIWAFLLVDLATASMETYQNLPFFFLFMGISHLNDTDETWK